MLYILDPDPKAIELDVKVLSTDNVESGSEAYVAPFDRNFHISLVCHSCFKFFPFYSVFNIPTAIVN